MRKTAPLERVESVPPVPVVGRAGKYALGFVTGSLIAALVGQAFGWELSDPTATAAIAASGVCVAVATVLLLTAVRNVGWETQFYEDSLVVASLGRLGSVRETTEVAYDDVDLAVRGGLVANGRKTTATYVLVRSDDPPVVLRNLDDPQAAERTLSERVPSPDERARRVEDDYGDPRGYESNSGFWRDWPAEEPLPSSPVVDRSGLPAGVELADADLPSEGGDERTEGMPFFWSDEGLGPP